jgi:hypothetical protein
MSGLTLTHEVEAAPGLDAARRGGGGGAWLGDKAAPDVVWRRGGTGAAWRRGRHGGTWLGSGAQHGVKAAGLYG